jgi:hypothetical protein
LSLLPPKKREIYCKFYIEGKTQVEIGKELSITQSTVSEHLSFILKHLNSAISAEMPWLKKSRKCLMSEIDYIYSSDECPEGPKKNNSTGIG